MKKRSLKNLRLNKKTVSNLNSIKAGSGSTGPNDGSWYYCDSDGLGCILRTRLFDDCPKCDPHTLEDGQMGPCIPPIEPPF